MQLRDDMTHAFAMTFKDRPLELGELAFGLLANNLRFFVPNKNESNKGVFTSWKNMTHQADWNGWEMLDKAKYNTSLFSKLTAHLQRIESPTLSPIFSMTRNMKKKGEYLLNNKDIPVWEKYTLTIEEASKYFAFEKQTKTLDRGTGTSLTVIHQDGQRVSQVL